MLFQATQFPSLWSFLTMAAGSKYSPDVGRRAGEPHAHLEGEVSREKEPESGSCVASGEWHNEVRGHR